MYRYEFALGIIIIFVSRHPVPPKRSPLCFLLLIWRYYHASRTFSTDSTTEIGGGGTRSGGAVCYAMAHNSLVLSRDFHVSGSLLRCMTATISKDSFLIWYITPYGNLLVRQRRVRFDSLSQASGYWTIRSSVLFTSVPLQQIRNQDLRSEYCNRR